MLNWHPVVDYEIREIERKQRMQQLESEAKQRQSEFEQREIAHALRMKQLKSEIAREAELNARIAALWPSSTSSSTQQTPPPEPGSPI